MDHKEGKKNKELSKDVFLTTTDYFHNDGTIARVDFELEVKRDRQVVFDVDFSGSHNMVIDGSAEEQDTLMKRTIVEPFSKQVVGSLRVADLKKKWSLQCSYTWIEKEFKRKEISPQLILTTVDNFVKGHALTSIEYFLKVEKNKRVVFDIDFKGSKNMELSTGGLNKKTSVEPFAEEEVAFLQVKNSKKSWYIECKYKWSEENPNQTVLGQPEQKEISPGILLVTTRTSEDTFKYEVICAKYSVIHFTLDCSDSQNMLVHGGGLTTHTTIQPWDRQEVGIVVVEDPSKSWSLKIKFEWSESDPQASPREPSPGPAQLLKPTPSATENKPTEIPDSIQAHKDEIKAQKCEEIAPNIFISMKTTTSPMRVIYTLDIQKNSKVVFHMDFSGSRNLVLAHGGTKTKTSVLPFEPCVVAVLVVENPAKEYQLCCKYQWEENELAKAETTRSSTFPNKPSRLSDFNATTRNNMYTYNQTDQLPMSEYPPRAPSVLRGGEHNRQMVFMGDRPHSPPSMVRRGPGYDAGHSPPRSYERVIVHQNGANAPFRSVAELLTRIGLPQYIVKFQEEDLNLDLLLSMAKDESELKSVLKELDVASVGHRAKIVLALKSMLEPSDNEAVEAF